VTIELPAFNYKRVTGKWTLEVDGLAGGTLTSWSLDILGSAS
jgi:subtilisin-like proprotein convertase family protein